jgi:hypothetical protein
MKIVINFELPSEPKHPFPTKEPTEFSDNGKLLSSKDDLETSKTVELPFNS